MAIINGREYDEKVLSGADETYMSDSDYKKVQDYKELFKYAQENGDQAGMDMAHEGAEAIRKKYNYSGGGDGSEYIKLSSSSKSDEILSGGSGIASSYTSSSGNVSGLAQSIKDNQSRIDALTEQLNNMSQIKYDYKTDPNYQALEKAYKELEGWAEGIKQNQGKIDEITEQLLNAEKFTYDYKTDPKYQALERAYIELGDRSEDDTLAKLSARTGGLASSYAARAAAGAKNDYIYELAGKIPELEQLNYEMYLDDIEKKRADLNMLYGIANDNADRAAAQYQSTLKADSENTKLARERVENYLANGGDPANLDESLIAASGYSYAEIAAMQGQASKSENKSISSLAMERVENYLANGGDPTYLDESLIAASGYTAAEIAAMQAKAEYARMLELAKLDKSNENNGEKSDVEDEGKYVSIYESMYEAGVDPDSKMDIINYLMKETDFDYTVAVGYTEGYQEYCASRAASEAKQEDDAFLKVAKTAIIKNHGGVVIPDVETWDMYAAIYGEEALQKMGLIKGYDTVDKKDDENVDKKDDNTVYNGGILSPSMLPYVYSGRWQKK